MTLPAVCCHTHLQDGSPSKLPEQEAEIETDQLDWNCSSWRTSASSLVYFLHMEAYFSTKKIFNSKFQVFFFFSNFQISSASQESLTVVPLLTEGRRLKARLSLGRLQDTVSKWKQCPESYRVPPRMRTLHKHALQNKTTANLWPCSGNDITFIVSSVSV